MGRHLRHAALLSLALLLPSAASAGNVYLNGQPVDGLANLKLDKVTVTFDAAGNVRIDAPGYAVQTLTTNGATTTPVKLGEGTPVAAVMAPAVITKHYFLVTEQAATGMSGYDIDVFVNSKWIRKLKGSEDQIVIELTKYLQPGQNKVLFAAKKIPGDRKSFSPSHTFNVTIGEGAAGGDQVMIDNPMLTFKRTAADTDDVSEEYSLTAR